MKKTALLFLLPLLVACTIAREANEIKGHGYTGSATITDGPIQITASMEDSFSYLHLVVKNTGADTLQLNYPDWTLSSKMETAAIVVFDKPYGFYHGELPGLGTPLIPAGATVNVFVGMRTHISNVEDDDEWKMNSILPSKNPKYGELALTLAYSFTAGTEKTKGSIVVPVK